MGNRYKGLYNNRILLLRLFPSFLGPFLNLAAAVNLKMNGVSFHRQRLLPRIPLHVKDFPLTAISKYTVFSAGPITTGLLESSEINLPSLSVMS